MTTEKKKAGETRAGERKESKKPERGGKGWRLGFEGKEEKREK